MKKLTREDVSIELEVEFDDIPVRGNAIDSGDDEFDRQVEDEILERLDSGDVWAWASVCVRVSCPDTGLQGEDYLGACRYKDENDFKSDVYYDDMIDRAVEDLNEKRKMMRAALCK